MQPHNHILGLVAHDDEKASLLLLQSIADQRADALVSARQSQPPDKTATIPKSFDVFLDDLHLLALHLANSLSQPMVRGKGLRKTCWRAGRSDEFIAGPLWRIQNICPGQKNPKIWRWSWILPGGGGRLAALVQRPHRSVSPRCVFVFTEKVRKEAGDAA